MAKGTPATNAKDMTHITEATHGFAIRGCNIPRISNPYTAPVVPLTNHKLCCFVTRQNCNVPMTLARVG
jgi:hypothetical protein